MIKKIALVTGGYSGEAVISYKSAVTIQNNLDKEKWEVYTIDIHPQGWFYLAEDGKKIAVDKNDFSIIIDETKINFDAVLIGLHGTPGEDGKLQGYLDCLKIPYTGCDAAVSAITFNKRYTVAVAAFADLSVARSMHLFKNHPVTTDEILADIKLPVFVKPNNGGSSIGMSKVKDAADLQPALKKAFAEDDQVLVEEFIAGREFTEITEIISKKEFFDYEAKYEGASEEVTPAQVDHGIAEQIREDAKKTYAIFNCAGVVRIDFIYNETDKLPYLLEINTVPGQSAASIVPQQVVAMGWTLKDFYSEILEECFGNNL
ncbi:MAG: D-alanine--D-alanine ligase [Chitinophagaceae bacterium]|nr:D-alanine--D-alanine ligase [Chitinophagaceae bacterium]